MFKDILLPINLSDQETWKSSVEKGVEFARVLGANLHVMTVLPRFDYPIVESFFPVDFETKARERVDKELHQFIKDQIPSGIKVQTIVAVGSIYEQILETAEKTGCDLIIMCRRGETRRNFRLGSNVDKVIHHATAAVLVLE